MSVLYGDDGIAHRLRDSEPAVLVTDETNAPRFEASGVPLVVLSADSSRRALRRARGGWTLRRTIPHSSTTRRARASSRRGSSMHTATSWGTKSSSTATRSRTASAFTGWASGHGRRGIAPLLGPWRLGAVQCVYQREGGFDPHRQLDFLSRHRGDECLYDADGDAVDDGRSAMPAHATPAHSAASARPGSRSTPRPSVGSARSTASPSSTTTA